MAGWGEALAILGHGAAGGFKAAGEVADTRLKTMESSSLQMAVDKRKANLARFQSEEKQKDRDVTVSEGLLGRESRERIAKDKPAKRGAFEEKWEYITEILGEEKARDLLETSEKGTGKVALSAKLKVDTLMKAYEMRSDGATDEEINAVLKAADVPEWIRTKTGKVLKSGGFLGFGQTEEAETSFGPGKGLLGGERGEIGGTEDDSRKGTSIDALFSEADQLLLKKPKTPELVSPRAAEEPSIGREELGGILSKPTEYGQPGVYKPYEVAPGETPSFKEKIQDWAGKTTPEGMAKFGEGVLETTIRQAGFGKGLSQIKGMAENLRKQYPGMSEEELVQLVKKIAAGEQP